MHFTCNFGIQYSHCIHICNYLYTMNLQMAAVMEYFYCKISNFHTIDDLVHGKRRTIEYEWSK